MRGVLIANPKSGSGGDPRALARALAQAGYEHVELLPIDRLDHARALPDVDRLIVAGGDGSIAACAEVARWLDVPLALIPVGTANDFARALRIPRDQDAAIALAAAPDAVAEPCELASVSRRRPFVNVAACGLATVAARRAQPLKAPLGPLAYAVGALNAGLTSQPLKLRVRVDGEEIVAGEAWQVIVAVTGAFGGGAQIEGTNTSDGLLDLVVVRGGPRVQLAQRAWGLRTRSIGDQTGVERLRGSYIELERLDGEPLDLNVDGELLRLDRGRATFTAQAHAFEVLTP